MEHYIHIKTKKTVSLTKLGFSRLSPKNQKLLKPKRQPKKPNVLK